jgi:hypothetical protein
MQSRFRAFRVRAQGTASSAPIDFRESNIRNLARKIARDYVRIT